MALEPRFITAVPTPLEEEDTLHAAGLSAVIADQLRAGIDGLLVAGTMGAMQLLSDETYHDLVLHSVREAGGRCELLIGAGDTSFSRTLQRIRFLNTLDIDGVVVLAPYMSSPTQAELRSYFKALADETRAPLFLYDHPHSTRVKLSLETVLDLASHPNIRGIKCSDDPSYMRQLSDMIGDRFRVVIAAPLLMDMFLRQGMNEHLDGVYCLCPQQIVEIGRAAARGDWQAAAKGQQGLCAIMRLLVRFGVWPAINALLNYQGVPGKLRPRPFLSWDERETETFFADIETRACLAFLSDRAVVKTWVEKNGSPARREREAVPLAKAEA